MDKVAGLGKFQQDVVSLMAVTEQGELHTQNNPVAQT